MFKYAPNYISAMRFERLRRDRQVDKQHQLLMNIVAHAKSNTVFYRHIDPDFLPFTEKSDLQNSKENFLSSPTKPSGVWRSTSGSSGKMVHVYWDENNLFMRFIFMYRAFAMIGLNPFKKLIYALPDREETRTSLGLFRNRHISLRDGIDKNLNIIKHFKPHLLSVYPSYALSLADKADPEDFKFLETISLNSENVLDHHLKKLTEVFSVPIFQEYSTVELGVVAAMCQSRNMHIFTDNVYLEAVNEDGLSCANGEEGELVATTLQSYGMPLIRYRTGDLGAIDKLTLCPCGRESPILLNLRGRQDDYLIGERGRKIPAWQLYEAIERPVEDGHIFKDIYLSQTSAETIDFYFIADQDFSIEIQNKIEASIQSLCGASLNVMCHKCEVIPRPSAVKRKYIHRDIHES